MSDSTIVVIGLAVTAVGVALIRDFYNQWQKAVVDSEAELVEKKIAFYERTDEADLMVSVAARYYGESLVESGDVPGLTQEAAMVVAEKTAEMVYNLPKSPDPEAVFVLQRTLMEFFGVLGSTMGVATAEPTPAVIRYITDVLGAAKEVEHHQLPWAPLWYFVGALFLVGGGVMAMMKPINRPSPTPPPTPPPLPPVEPPPPPTPPPVEGLEWATIWPWVAAAAVVLPVLAWWLWRWTR